MISWQKIPAPETFPEKINYTEAVIMRRSLRNFVRKSLPKAYYQSLIKMLCEGGADDDLNENAVCIGFLAGNVEGIEPGYYLLNRSDASAALVNSGFFMEKMAHICLDQEWLANAALHFFLSQIWKFWKSIGAHGAIVMPCLRQADWGKEFISVQRQWGLGVAGSGHFMIKKQPNFSD